MRPAWKAGIFAELTVAIGEYPVLLAAGRRVCGQAGNRTAEHLLVGRLQSKRHMDQTVGRGQSSWLFLQIKTNNRNPDPLKLKCYLADLSCSAELATLGMLRSYQVLAAVAPAQAWTTSIGVGALLDRVVPDSSAPWESSKTICRAFCPVVYKWATGGT